MKRGQARVPREQPLDEEKTTRKAIVRDERFELLEHLQATLEPAMATLGLVFLGLLLLDYAAIDLGDRGHVWLDRALQAIWAIFLLDFGVRFIVAPAKLRFLRENWLGALSLALPFLRPLRALRAARALRSLSLVRLLGGVNRGMRVLRRVTRGRQFAYVGALTLLVTAAGAVGALFFDRDTEGTTIRSFGDALWWAAALVTTVNSEKYAVSPEARIIAILIRVFAVSVFGFVTASIASYLVGRDVEERAPTGEGESAVQSDVTVMREELVALHRDVIQLRRQLAAALGRNNERPTDTEAPPS